jgi:hypothetical protein
MSVPQSQSPAHYNMSKKIPYFTAEQHDALKKEVATYVVEEMAKFLKEWDVPSLDEARRRWNIMTKNDVGEYELPWQLEDDPLEYRVRQVISVLEQIKSQWITAPFKKVDATHVRGLDLPFHELMTRVIPMLLGLSVKIETDPDTDQQWVRMGNFISETWREIAGENTPTKYIRERLRQARENKMRIASEIRETKKLIRQAKAELEWEQMYEYDLNEIIDDYDGEDDIEYVSLLAKSPAKKKARLD